MTLCGRGMLPIGSVGMVISKPRQDSDARQALPLLTIISHASMRRPRTRLAVVEIVGEGRGTDAQPLPGIAIFSSSPSCIGLLARSRI